MNSSEPLGLPRGSVRAILALLIVGSAVLFEGISMATGVETSGNITTLAGGVAMYYFVKRDSEAPVGAAEPPLPKGFVPGEDDED